MSIIQYYTKPAHLLLDQQNKKTAGFFSLKNIEIFSKKKTLLPLSQTKTNLFVNSLDEKLLISIFFIDTCDMIENHPKTMVGI
jgi:hypothetical protein